jgi:hypothetical protein
MMLSRKALSLANGERRRLSSSGGGGDWNLTRGTTITRTRGIRKQLAPIVLAEEPSAVDEELFDEQEATAAEPAEEEEPSANKRRKIIKPNSNRVILEVEQVDDAMNNVACRDCGSNVKATLRTVCLATTICIECTNDYCGYISEPKDPATTTIHMAQKDGFERSTDYGINVLYVLGFISMGDGCSEAARLLGLLGLPNDTTMKSRSFTIIEDRLGPIIRKLCNDMLLDNLIDEARLSMEKSETLDADDFKVWKDALTNKSIDLPLDKKPKIEGSYDMAWQQKGSGHQYNSKTGHGALIGRHTRKVIGLTIKCKVCNICIAWDKKHPEEEDGIEAGPHECWKNHNGSSGSMESAGAVELLVKLFDDYNAVVHLLCCDDDSSVRADCKWNNADYMAYHNTTSIPMVPITKGPNKGILQPRPNNVGKLPVHVPEPLFVADPNHRCKLLTGELIALDKSRADLKCTMTRMDSTRIGKNFGYMARTLKNIPPSEYVKSATAVLDHHFGVHDNCGLWCPRRLESASERAASKKYYRCKQTDAKLYALLVKTTNRFFEFDKLNEMAHNLDTNMNEGFNNVCTWFAPKNKVFAGSGSLNNRLAFAVGINSIGLLPFFAELFVRLGIDMTDNVKHYLRVSEGLRIRKQEKEKTNEAKKGKNEAKYIKLREDTIIAKMEWRKREGTYRSGMNLDDPSEVVPEDATRKPKKKKVFCEFCGAAGHTTKRAKKCTAADNATRQFRKNGSLLTDPDPDPPEEEAAVDATGLLAEDAEIMRAARAENQIMEVLHWDHDLKEEDAVSLTDSCVFMHDASWEAGSDDDSSVEVVGGTI